MTVVALDATGTKVNMSTTTDGSGNIVGATCVTDPVSGAKQTVSQLHNADQQTVPSSANSTLSTGVAQLQDPVSNLVNRAREAGQDNISPLGLAAGTANLAMQFKTTCTQNLAIGVTTMTLAAVSGTVGGVPWQIRQGSKLVVDSGAAQETLSVASVNTSTKVVTFTNPTVNAHNGSVTAFPVTGNAYNQSRDASGENDGASGAGTAIAAEYEFNGGDPSGGNFDRARSVNGKGLITQTISAGGGVGSTSLTVASNAGLQPGMKVLLYKSSTFPAAGSFESVNVDLSYAAGANTVPLASGIIASVGYDTLAYDGFAALGPGLNGFLPFGVGIEEEALYDPVSGKFYLERAATQDAMPAANIVAESPALFNGSTMDRARGNVDTGAVATLVSASVTGNSADQINYNGRGLQLGINVTAITGTTPTLTVTIQGKDTASGQYYTLLQSAALNATGFTQLTVYPGAPSTANVSSPQVLPRTWRVLFAIAGGSPSISATIGASVIL